MSWIFMLGALFVLILLIAFIMDKKNNVKNTQKVDEEKMDKIQAEAEKKRFF